MPRIMAIARTSCALWPQPNRLRHGSTLEMRRQPAASWGCGRLSCLRASSDVYVPSVLSALWAQAIYPGVMVGKPYLVAHQGCPQTGGSYLPSLRSSMGLHRRCRQQALHTRRPLNVAALTAANVMAIGELRTAAGSTRRSMGLPSCTTHPSGKQRSTREKPAPSGPNWPARSGLDGHGSR